MNELAKCVSVNEQYCYIYNTYYVNLLITYNHKCTFNFFIFIVIEMYLIFLYLIKAVGVT